MNETEQQRFVSFYICVFHSVVVQCPTEANPDTSRFDSNVKIKIKLKGPMNQ